MEKSNLGLAKLGIVTVFACTFILTGCMEFQKAKWLEVRDESTLVKSDKVIPMKNMPGFRVQLGSMQSYDGAQGMGKAVMNIVPGVKAHVITEGGLYKVRMGDCKTKEEASKLRDQFVKLGYTDCWIASDSIEVPLEAGEEVQLNPSKWSVQISSTRLKESADTIKTKVAGTGITDPVFSTLEGDLYKVRVGQFDTREQAEAMRQKMVGIGYTDAWLRQPSAAAAGTTASASSTSSGAGLKYSAELLDNIKIGILKGRPTVTVYSNGKFSFLDKNGVVISSAAAWDMWTIKIKGEGGAAKTVFRAAPASYSSQENADTEANKIKQMITGVPVYVIYESPWYKVRVGDAATREEAEKLKTQLVASGYDQTWIHQMIIPPTTKSQLELVTPAEQSFGVFDDLIAMKSEEEGKSVGVAGKLYRRNLEIRIGMDGLLSVINQLPIDEYVNGVVPAEIGTNAPLEAQKAQAVAARTETLAKLGRHKTDGFDLCSEVHCQAYGGLSRESAPTNDAVAQTKGEVITFNGNLASTVYSAVCGGFMEDPGAVWGGGSSGYMLAKGDFDEALNKEYKVPLSESQFTQWVKSKPEAYCMNATRYRWTKEFKKSELEVLINKTIPIGTLQEIKLGDRGPAGTLRWVEIVGSNTSKKVEKEYSIRMALGGVFAFNTGKFVLEKDKDAASGEEIYRFIGCGWGHGVGMCQEGAIGMGNKGKKYNEILMHYFPGTVIKKIY